MNNSLTHRGPDDQNIYTDKNISLGHRRLSIIDLSKAGQQPMCNEEGTILVTFNGEIYNYKELKNKLEKKGHKFKSKTDTEVLIHGYEEFKENLFRIIEGQFAFAILDKNKKKIIVARDRIGIKPLYYHWDNERFIFSSDHIL